MVDTTDVDTTADSRDSDTSPPSDAVSIAAASTHRPRASSAVVVLATLAVGYTLWATQELVLPILLAMFLALIGNPILRMLQKLYIPRSLGAIAILSGGLASAILLGNLLAEPATNMMRELPRGLSEITPKLRKVVKPVQDAKKGAENIARAAGGEGAAPVRVVRTEVNDPYRALLATPRMIASVLAVILLTLFFMVYGENLQRRALALLPSRQQQKITVEILHSIEREMSRYVLTITVINVLLGLLFAAALVALGLEIPEALLWGTFAALLNYAPYVGPLIGILAMLLMGFMHFNDPLQALLPAGAYLLLHTLEGQLITPIVLGRRMALSPLMLILGLMIFGWLWGIVGLLLAVPLLACTKLVLDRIEGMEPWARLLE